MRYTIYLYICICFIIINNSNRRMFKKAEVIYYLNLARQKPSHYLELIIQQLSLFENQMEISIEPEILYETNEGKKAWLQAKQFLKQQCSLSALIHHDGLTLAAQDHVNDISYNQIFGHIGSDQSTFSDRVKRYCKKGTGCMVEIIGADFLLQNRNIPEMTILGLIIDDGVKDRGHRNAIYNPAYKYFGTATAIQADKMLTVINLSESNLELKSNIPRKIEQSNKNVLPEQNLKISTKQISAKQNQQPISYQKNSKINRNINIDSQTKSQQILNQQRFQREEVVTDKGNKKDTQSYKLPTLKNIGNAKKIKQKKEFTKTIYENGYKISQLRTVIRYLDGSVEQNTERVTSYANGNQ